MSCLPGKRASRSGTCTSSVAARTHARAASTAPTCASRLARTRTLALALTRILTLTLILILILTLTLILILTLAITRCEPSGVLESWTDTLLVALEERSRARTSIPTYRKRSSPEA